MAKPGGIWVAIGGTVDAPSESVILEHFGKLSEGDFLILNNASDEFVQTLLQGQDSYILEYQANGIQFSSDPQPVSKTLAEGAFTAFLLYGPNSIEFQSSLVWVNSEFQPESVVVPKTTTVSPWPWELRPGEDKPHINLGERSTMSKLAQQLIAKNKKNKSTTLDLGNCDLIAVPSKVSQMDWLTSLSLRGNDDLGTEISDLAPLTGLVSLRTLGLYGTQVSSSSRAERLRALGSIR